MQIDPRLQARAGQQKARTGNLSLCRHDVTVNVLSPGGAHTQQAAPGSNSVRAADAAVYGWSISLLCSQRGWRSRSNASGILPRWYKRSQPAAL
jgi:hypothetical protein